MKYRTIVADPPWPLGEFPPTGKYQSCPRPYDTMRIDEIAALDVSCFAALGCHLYLWTTNAYLWVAREVAERWGFSVSCVLTWCKPPTRHGVGMGGKFASTTEFVLFGYEQTAKKRFGRWLREQREAAGFSVTDVARHFPSRSGGLTGCVWNWENGANVPTPEEWETLRRLIKFDDGFDEELAAYHRAVADVVRCDTRWWNWPRGRHSQKPEAFFDLIESVSPGPYLELFARRQRLGWDTWGDEALNHVEIAS